MAAGYVDDHKLILYRDGAQPRPALNIHISIPKEVLKLDGENN
mgnify:CR=1 FL=1